MKIKLNNDWSWPVPSDNTSGARWVAGLLPPYRTVAVSCGGSMLMALRLSTVEIYNDLQGDVYNFFRVVRDSQSRHELLELIQAGTAPLMLLAAVRPDDPVLRAYYFYESCRRWWVPDLSKRWLNRAHVSRPFSDAAKLFNPIIDRFYGAQIEDKPADDVISRYDTPQTVHLVDLSLVTASSILDVVSALSKIKGKAVVLNSTQAESSLLTTWRTVVPPFGTTRTALVNFPETKRKAA